LTDVDSTLFENIDILLVRAAEVGMHKTSYKKQGNNRKIIVISQEIDGKSRIRSVLFS